MLSALSFYNPGAMLVALGVQQTTTRAIGTGCRGPVLIHAMPSHPPGYGRLHAELLAREDVRGPLSAAGFGDPATLPAGAFVALAVIQTAAKCGKLVRAMIEAEHGPRELALSDFSDGRWALSLTQVFRLPRPVPCPGPDQGGRMLWPPSPPAFLQVQRMIAALEHPPREYLRALFGPSGTFHDHTA